MAQTLADYFGVDSLLKHESGVDVAQVVEAIQCNTVLFRGGADAGD